MVLFPGSIPQNAEVVFGEGRNRIPFWQMECFQPLDQTCRFRHLRINKVSVDSSSLQWVLLPGGEWYVGHLSSQGFFICNEEIIPSVQLMLVRSSE